MKSVFTTALIATSLFCGAAYASPASSGSAAPASSMSSASSSMSDNGFFFKPYVGADYQYFTLDYHGVTGSTYNYGQFFANSFNGGDVHIGARVHKYLGFEASYFQTASESKSALLGTTASSSAKFHGESLDAMGYLPLGGTKAELIALVGVNSSKATGSVVVSGNAYNGNASKTFAEFGGGAQYWINDNLSARILERYEDISGNVINSAWTTSVGLNWQF